MSYKEVKTIKNVVIQIVNDPKVICEDNHFIKLRMVLRKTT